MQRPSPSGSARAGGEVPEHGSGFARPVVGYLIFRGALHALVNFLADYYVPYFWGISRAAVGLSVAGANRQSGDWRSQVRPCDGADWPARSGDPGGCGLRRDNVLDWRAGLEFCRATAAGLAADLCGI